MCRNNFSPKFSDMTLHCKARERLVALAIKLKIRFSSSEPVTAANRSVSFISAKPSSDSIVANAQ
jgi:hypothetical protein